MSYHTGGMRTTMGRTMSRRTNVPRTRRTTTPRRGRMMNGNGRMMNGSGTLGVRRTAGQFGRGTVQRPGPIVRGGRTQPVMNRTQARGMMTSGIGNHGFRGVDRFGRNT